MKFSEFIRNMSISSDNPDDARSAVGIMMVLAQYPDATINDVEVKASDLDTGKGE